MAVKWKVKKDLTPKMEKAARALHGRWVHAGVTGPHAQLARIHEYGCQIPVSERMRGFFAARFGIRLAKTTRVIVIPPRPFLRTGHDACIGEVLALAAKGLPQVLVGQRPPTALMAAVGGALCRGIKAQAQSGGFAKNAPLTVQNKGHDRPLIESGAMLEGLRYELGGGG